MNYEIVFENEYFVKIRITNGVVINIYKFKLGCDLFIKGKDVKKIDDYIYELKTYSKSWNDTYYPKGTKVFKFNSCSYYSIKEIYKDKKYWNWELKTTGNSFSGNTREFVKLVSAANKIIKEI